MESCNSLGTTAVIGQLLKCQNKYGGRQFGRGKVILRIMTDDLERYLHQLNSCLTSRSANRGNEAADVCNDLSWSCIDSITETEIGLLLLIIFCENCNTKQITRCRRITGTAHEN